MKNRFFATLSSLTLLTAAAGFAQSNIVLKADIPFEFRVGTTVLPAGHYDVRSQVTPGVLLIRCIECQASALIQTSGIEAKKRPETATLVFSRYDSTHFLSTVWTPGHSRGLELPKSKAEREFARSSSPVAVVLAPR